MKIFFIHRWTSLHNWNPYRMKPNKIYYTIHNIPRWQLFFIPFLFLHKFLMNAECIAERIIYIGRRVIEMIDYSCVEDHKFTGDQQMYVWLEKWHLANEDRRSSSNVTIVHSYWWLLSFFNAAFKLHWFFGLLCVILLNSILDRTQEHHFFRSHLFYLLLHPLKYTL